MKNEEDHIPKSLLVINNFILVIGSIAVIIGLIFFIKYMIELDLKYENKSSSVEHAELTNYKLFSNCQFPNGTYKTIYDKQFYNYPEFVFKITDDSLFTKDQRLKIERFSNSSFRIEFPEINQDSLTDFQKKIADDFKFSYYEILECKKDTFKFLNTHNLHITISSGIFVKLE
ncbi:hypothetical protein JCM19298_1586 [Nonlabens ulvanivorans]|nr:hypothetical protein [Nonlabens ulvanivorans]GAK95257.1 hypothetical protein JCM19298_1586 [Nonlabens ulvanivorans]